MGGAALLCRKLQHLYVKKVAAEDEEPVLLVIDDNEISRLEDSVQAA